ncbi:DUF6512 family protein [Clostridium cellulovorans]|uniref:Uncharacterized protein n=1 Tax=Clostridium cellulovorans (strain ATCC 35296 / DSM 3052 / OCM 3 / 743B) TaxID=573061 RepID=D9SRA0_CLOC7|nr:DUF6512 family protein [Clostridium cellulovorans]ADL52329.1 hypothetical protein Clocel_2625 [Clostridium cellulovorans 743B]
MSYKTLSSPAKWILIGIPILFLVGSCLHFLYDFTGDNIIIGTIAPVNESVWEHLKMVLLPIILWWTVYYLVVGKINNIDINKWFTGALVALLTALITIPLLFYFYTRAFGVEFLIVDILLLFLALLFGQLIGLHFYKYYKGLNSIITIGTVILIIFLFILFTFYPPHLPLFKDSITGKYGIF